MKPKWVIEDSPLDREIWDRAASLLTACGHEVVRIPFTPLGGLELPFSDRDCVIGFGSLALAKNLNRKSYVPGVWCDFDQLKCHRYLSKYCQQSIQQEFGFYPLSALWLRTGFLYATYAHKDSIFVRPDDNFKSFNAEVVHSSNLKNFIDYLDSLRCDDDQLILVSKPSQIMGEWRTVVVDGKVISGSQYRNCGLVDIKPGYPVEVSQFAESIASIWQPSRIFCVDVAQNSTGHFSLMEIGAINCAGLYECELQPILDACNRVAVEEYNELNAQ